MPPEPRPDTMDISQLVWKNWTEPPEGTNVTSLNATAMTRNSGDSAGIRHIVVISVTVLICLCGMVGNGTVVWLLGFRLKRNPYSIYIFNLAIADFIYLLADVLEIIAQLQSYFRYFYWFTNTLAGSSHFISLILLMAISTERCVSVLWPLWYKSYRPACLPITVCALIWLLGLAYFSVTSAFDYFRVVQWHIMWLLCNVPSLLALPMLFVSSLVLFSWGRCYSRQRQSSKLYMTILLNVLAVLLLNVPRGVYALYLWPDISQSETEVSQNDIWDIMILLSAMNSAVNPIIYFFVGRHGKEQGRRLLREVLQSALTDEEPGTEQKRGTVIPRQDLTTPEHQEGGAMLCPRD